MDNIIKIQHQAYVDWMTNNGPNNEGIRYPLNENSIVVDFGGYHGVWTTQVINTYNPNVIIVEPIPAFCDILRNKFSNNPKVTILNYGISTTNSEGVLFLNADGTSKYTQTATPVKVKFITITDFLTMVNNPHIDLLQINIEGEEYPLLEKMLEDKTILNFTHIQIQYHLNVENCVERRKKIQEKMSEYFNKTYDYPFIWEGWSLK